eukprot:GHVS01084120.1.p1 GENE.GHVS01084120.1~~GHVS01084120.1.p1  ORF type:complete len:164 (+),score=40.37 GHVS01084120.1:15-506(+)
MFIPRLSKASCGSPQSGGGGGATPAAASRLYQRCSPVVLSSFRQRIDKELSWWRLYITGRNPHYPPRTEMYEFLTQRGVAVEFMQVREIEDFTKWVQTRIQFGIKYPQFPYGTLEDKVDEYKQKYPMPQQRQTTTTTTVHHPSTKTDEECSVEGRSETTERST